MTSIFVSARYYLSNGFSVVPVKPGAKSPAIRWEEYQNRLPTEAEVRSWFAEHPERGIAVVCGNVSGGLIVFDFDGDAWREALDTFLDRFPKLRETWHVVTGSGKRHIWVRCPGLPSDLTRLVRDLEPCGIRAKVELRANEHYVLAPPSGHPSGGFYRWVEPRPELLEISAEDLEEIRSWFEPDKPQPKPKNLADPPSPSLEEGHKRAAAEYYLLRALDQANPGNRNDTGFWLACQLRDLGLSEEEAVEFMCRYAEGVPQGGEAYTVQEALASLRQAYKHEPREPAVPGRSSQGQGLTPESAMLGGDQAEGKKQCRKLADRLVGHVRDAFSLFVDEADEPHIGDESGQVVRLRSRAARERMAKLFFDREGRGIPASAISEAMPTIAAFCRQGGRKPVAVRVGRLGEHVYIDLGNLPPRVVRVGPDGWQVIDAAESPVRFVRPSGTLPLPEPERGGSWDELRKLIRTDEQGFILVAAWLLGALSGRGPYAILALFGPQGSGKSTTARTLIDLVDPRKASLGAQPREVRDLMIAASNAHVLAYDNLSAIPEWLSDALCRLATGAGYRTRALFEDAEEVLFEASRPIIINGIVDLIKQGDLADRALAVRLDLMPPSARKPEAELRAEYEKVRPRIFGVLLDALAMGLAREREITEPLPRLADFARLVLAATPALPFTAEEFLRAYGAAQADLQVAVLDDPFAQALLEYLEREGAFEGTAGDLLERLTEGRDRPPAGWPKTPRGVSAEIARLEPALVALGYTVERTKDGHTRRRVYRIQGESDPVGRFVEEKCERDKDISAKGRELYQAFREWAAENNKPSLSPKEFSRRLEEMGFKRRETREGVFFDGLELLFPPSSDGAPL